MSDRLSLEYVSPVPWSPQRPSILVMACSDGRLEKETDDFLVNHLGISRYDRLYIPGGAGALASSGFEFLRADQHRRECRFLIEAHQVKEVILIFHSGSVDGPEDAMCADYRRKLPAKTTEELRAQQDADAIEVARYVLLWPPDLRVRAYRAEVIPEHRVRFVELTEARK